MTAEQNKIIEALATEHGASKVLPLRGTDAVLACGWNEDDPPPMTAEIARGLAIRWATGRLSHNNSMLMAERDSAGRDAARLAAIDHARRDAWCYVHRDLTPVGADPTMVEPSPRSVSRPSKPVKPS